MSDIMLDLETMSTESNAAIIAIGAVSFSDKIESEFYTEVSLNSSVDSGLHICPKTVLWWLSQSKDAQDKFKKNNKAPSLHDALLSFSEWAAIQKVGSIWGNGATFDNVILRNAFQNAGLEYPIPFWADACYRTVKNMNPAIELDRVGIHHCALDDAKSQALHLIKIFEAMKRNAN